MTKSEREYWMLKVRLLRSEAAQIEKMLADNEPPAPQDKPVIVRLTEMRSATTSVARA